MHLRNLTDVRRRNLNSFFCLLVFGIATCGAAIAQYRPTGGPTPSPPGAEVYFVDVKDGQHIPAKAVIHFSLRNMGVAPAGSDQANSGHHHLLIDSALSGDELKQPIAMDDTHRHFGAGQTEALITLPPGQHKLQLVLGDWSHIPHRPPVMSNVITVTVR